MKKHLLKMLSITLILTLLTPHAAAAASLPGQTAAETVSENNIENTTESGQEETEKTQKDVPENNPPEIERALTYHDAEDPVPVMTRAQENVYANRGSLPSSYSSVTAGNVPALKDQGSYGTCWAFAAVGASESGLLSRGLAGADIDLSERHLAYYFYEKGTIGDVLGGTTGDYNKIQGGDRFNYMNRGGNSLYTMWHLASWAGLADESTAPYSGVQTALPKTTAGVYGADTYHLQNAYIVNKENRDVVKQLIMDYGSLAFAYYSASSYDYDNLQNDSYYFNIENSGTNHAVQVVGWDDNFSKDKFTITPPGDGAWLVKNSWGEDGGNYAQNGYFWLSYYDTSISDNFFAYICEKGDNYDNIYQYDGASGTRYITTKYAANVYTAKANAGGIEKIEAVGVGSYSNGVSYTVEIYTDLTDPSNPVSGTKAASQSGTLTYSGYHTIPLNTPVSIEEGQKFSVVFNFDRESSVYVDYSYGSNWIEFVTDEALGTSFYKMDYTGAPWVDAVDNASATFRVKAYTSNALPDASEPLRNIILDKTTLTLDKGTTAQLKVTYRPSYTTDDKTVSWSTSNAGVAAVDSNGKVTAVGAGTATITAVCQSKRATCTVTVKDMGVTVENLNNNTGTFTVKAAGVNRVSGVSLVQFAVWSEENGQDDLKWYTAVNNGNGVYTQNISIQNHGTRPGRYLVYVYVHDNAGTSHFFGATECTFTRTYLSSSGINAQVSADEESATITMTGVLGAVGLKFAVWSDENGQDDLIWYTARDNGNGTWTATVPVSRHGYSQGRYNVHAYGENLYSGSRMMTSTSFQISGSKVRANILSSRLQLVSHTNNQIVCRMDAVTDKKANIKYRWLIYDIALGSWTVEADWRENYQWLIWTPQKEGEYLILCEVETVSGSAKDSAVIGCVHSIYRDVKITGKCQMPYTGPGGGYLIGVETNKNPGQKLQYELLIMDCSLYAEGKPPWVWSTGKINVGEGNAFWAVWQPKYGYYWTYFRVYDENGNLIDDQCYGFANV